MKNNKNQGYMESDKLQERADNLRTEGTVETETKGTDLHLSFKGQWTIHSVFPSFVEIKSFFTNKISSISFNTEELQAWDSRFLIILNDIKEYANLNNILFIVKNLPSGVQRLLALASASPEKAPFKPEVRDQSFLETVGDKTSHLIQDCSEFLFFTGTIALSYLRLFSGKAQFLKSDFLGFLEECGPAALPIVSLISVLVGVILAFVGAVQLQLFGAEIYIANLVGLGMTREMGAMMAAIIMAGRTGAAFAAQLGTMQVNEEIDALQTMGIDPIDFLVLPRMSALLLMMPLLALWADLLGIGGGFLIAWFTLDISMIEYYNQTIGAVTLRHFGVGLFKAIIFGYLVAFSGCLRGIQCGRSASAVGAAATSAVVTAIVLIVVSDAVMTIIFNILGI
ncbi:MAG: ABC transporter permease [Proteobacteria bacterium]|jgi:phospholipid/cholesterol/gamma-HCH transport system permease protein|nr:ABC transporter permease [Pseudomonadota bacterium]MBU4027931.1 ABC transporter permease [Pseudomonadota bacterium]MBU4042417.1 ABC transporter permease [Pseudomonadota bacterium]MBU4085309.1 ABC transporter permease [Pseudomonadota bacterium]MBU4108713.1 ABC transporter permease [Pseudomonadota bacterium]